MTDNFAPQPADTTRRKFLKLPLAAGAVGGMAYLAWSQQRSEEPIPQANAQPSKPIIDEHDAKNIKLAHRVPSTLADDEILFLKQIGLRWMRVEFQAAEADMDRMAAVQKRFEK